MVDDNSIDTEMDFENWKDKSVACEAGRVTVGQNRTQSSGVPGARLPFLKRGTTFRQAGPG